jgi:AcrR family transcriptional regulator
VSRTAVRKGGGEGPAGVDGRGGAARHRPLTERQARTVDRLADAALDELLAVGYADITVRSVATRAGVAPATAYTYFASKEHLVAEVFWRRFAAQPEGPTDPGLGRAARAAAALSAFALVVADEAELAAACTVAVLAEDPDVKALRERIGAELHRRLVAALGPDVGPGVVRTLQFAAAGILVHVGTGHLGYDALPRLLDEVAGVVVGAGP